MAYQNSNFHPAQGHQMYHDANNPPSFPLQDSRPVQQQTYNPGPYAQIVPQQPQIHIQPQPQVYHGGGNMPPPSNMGNSMVGGRIPPGMPQQQMHLRNLSNSQHNPYNYPYANPSMTPAPQQPHPQLSNPSKPPYANESFLAPQYVATSKISPSLSLNGPTPKAEPLPNSRSPSQMQDDAPKRSPQPPLSSTENVQESRRVTALLDLNRALLQEVVLLQTAGKTGIPTQQTQPSPTASEQSNDGKEGSRPSQAKVVAQEYIACMRRLQANLAYLASIADPKLNTNAPRGPAIMDPPPIPSTGPSNLSTDGIETFETMYKGLGELFPDWRGIPNVSEKVQ